MWKWNRVDGKKKERIRSTHHFYQLIKSPLRISVSHFDFSMEWIHLAKLHGLMTFTFFPFFLHILKHIHFSFRSKCSVNLTWNTIKSHTICYHCDEQDGKRLFKFSSSLWQHTTNMHCDATVNLITLSVWQMHIISFLFYALVKTIPSMRFAALNFNFNIKWT